jgi:hypothetical protein
MIGVVGKGQLPMVNILKQRRNTRRLLLKVVEGTLEVPMETTLMR